MEGGEGRRKREREMRGGYVQRIDMDLSKMASYYSNIMQWSIPCPLVKLQHDDNNFLYDNLIWDDIFHDYVLSSIFYLSYLYKIHFSKNELLLCALICLLKRLVSFYYLKSVSLDSSIKGTLRTWSILTQ